MAESLLPLNFKLKSNTYVIAEIGINHNGSLENALRLIDIASSAGCNAVKFQKRNPDISVPEHQKYILKDTPWGRMKYIDYKHKIEFGRKEFDEIDKYCSERKIEWSASPWDLDSLKFLASYDVPFIKIPSAKLTDDVLLEESVKTGKKVIMSTGMSTQTEVEHAVDVLRNAKKEFKNIHTFGLLHCNSSYPASIDELNLSTLHTLADYFPDFEIGYSGHELTLGTTVAAVYLGATIIERHITLDRNMWGTDHSCSVTPWGLFKLVNGIRELEQAYGDGKIKVEKSEEEPKKKLRG